jgi:TctA family transporter
MSGECSGSTPGIDVAAFGAWLSAAHPELAGPGRQRWWWQ